MQCWNDWTIYCILHLFNQLEASCPNRIYFFYPGHLLLDCTWSYNIPLLICHGESDILYFQLHSLHIFSYRVWLAIGSISTTCSSVSSPCHISC